MDLLRQMNEASMRITNELSDLMVQLEDKTGDILYARDTLNSYQALANDYWIRK